MRDSELVIFDFDGTLVDTRPVMLFCLQRTFELYGAPVPEAGEAMRVLGAGLGLDEAVRVMRPGLSVEESWEWVTTWRSVQAEEGKYRARTYLGVEQVLEALAGRGARLAVVSNKGEEALLDAAEHAGISGYFEVIKGEVSGRPMKPDPRLYTDDFAPSFAGIAPERTMVVGDCKSDMDFARNIGAAACLAAYGYGDQDSCLATGPRHVINDIREILSLLDE